MLKLPSWVDASTSVVAVADGNAAKGDAAVRSPASWPPRERANFRLRPDLVPTHLGATATPTMESVIALDLTIGAADKKIGEMSQAGGGDRPDFPVAAPSSAGSSATEAVRPGAKPWPCSGRHWRAPATEGRVDMLGDVYVRCRCRRRRCRRQSCTTARSANGCRDRPGGDFGGDAVGAVGCRKLVALPERSRSFRPATNSVPRRPPLVWPAGDLDAPCRRHVGWRLGSRPTCSSKRPVARRFSQARVVPLTGRRRHAAAALLPVAGAPAS